MSGYLIRGTDRFPVHRLKRIERPATLILDDKVKRVDERESGFNKARRGDYGEKLIDYQVSYFGITPSLSPHCCLQVL